MVSVNVYSPLPTGGSIGDILQRFNVHSPKLLEADLATQELRLAEDSDKLFNQLRNFFYRNPRDYDSKRVESEAEFGTIWDYFPKTLQEQIVTASVMFDYYIRNGDIYCGDGISLLGRLCEHAIKLSFVQHFAAYLEVNKHASSLKLVNNESLAMHKAHQTWSDHLMECMFSKIEKLIPMAQVSEHPVANFMDANGIDKSTWATKQYLLITQVKELRNRATHDPNRQFSVAELKEIRAILWTRGLLYEVGELLRLCTAK